MSPGTKRMAALPRDAKINAYNDAIAALQALESDADEPGDRDARHWLADKLDKECQRWLKSLSSYSNPTKGD